MSQDSNLRSHNIWGLVARVTTGLVSGGAAAGLISHFDPIWTAIGSACVGIISGLATKIWKRFWDRIEPRIVEGVADSCATWLEDTAQEVFSGYYRYYCQQNVFLHRVFNVKGLSAQGPHALDLENVFVDLSLDPKSFQNASGNPIRVPEALSHGSHSIWELLSSRELKDHPFVILGAPGSGKTTLLQHIALILVAPNNQRNRSGVPKKLPILLFLRDIAEYINNATYEKPFDLADAIRATLIKEKLETGPSEWFEKQLNRGRCMVLLDGLDEVSDPNVRHKVVEWVEHQIRIHNKNRFIMTSRPYGYRDAPLSGVNTLEVRPFSSAQVEKFVRNWYLANEIKSQLRDDAGVKMEARKGADDLLLRLAQAPVLAELAVNPLLLTLIAHVHRFRSSLPGRRVELYAEICTVFLGRKQQTSGIEVDLTPQQKQVVLQPLAYYMMNKEGGEVSARDVTVEEAIDVIHTILQSVTSDYSVSNFLKMIENSSGLLIERGNGIYSFSHLTFQEYLAAAHIHEKGLESELLAHVTESWWHETIRLYVALGQGTAIIEACLEQASNSSTALALALDCNDEARTAEPVTRAKVEKLLRDGVESPNPILRIRAAETLLHRRLQKLHREDENLYIDTSLITHAEYQLFLDEKRAYGKFYQPDHWQSYHFPVGEGQNPVVGVRYSDALAFCEWLTERERGIFHFGIPQIVEHHSSNSSYKLVKYWIKNENGWSGKVLNAPPHAPIQFYFQPIEGECIFFTIDLNSSGKFQFNLDREFDIELDRELDIDRTLDIELDRELDRELERTLERELELVLETDIKRARDLAYNLVVARHNHNIQIHNNVRDLARDLARDLNCLCDHLYDLHDEQRLDAIYNIIQRLQEKAEFLLEQNRQQPCLFQIDSHYIFVVVDIIIRILSLYRNHDVENEYTLQQLRVDLRFHRRLHLIYRWYLQTLYMQNTDKGIHKWISLSICRRQNISKKSVSIEQNYIMHRYITMILLQERIQGRQQAFEGIRIVREKIEKPSP